MRIKTESKLTSVSAKLKEAAEIINELLDSTASECYQPGGRMDKARRRAVEFRNALRELGYIRTSSR